MIRLLDRQIEIITLLLIKDDYCAADKLAEALSVSNRTIRNDLNVIKLFLKQYGAQLKAEPHKGYKIVVDLDQKQEILNNLDAAKSLSQQEIINTILVLVLSDTNTTYESISQYLDLSKQTVAKYVDDVEEYLSHYNISLNKVKGKGISVVGNEYDIREMMKLILLNNGIDNYLYDILDKVLDDSSLVLAKQIISDIENKAKVKFYELKSLELLISYNLYRDSIGRIIDSNLVTEEVKKNDINKDYLLYYEALKQLSLPEAEKKYLLSILLASKVKYLDRTYDDDSDARQLADFLMKKLELLYPFSEEKKEKFLNGLTTHLSVALYRIRNNIPIKNELLDQIKISISLIYLYTKQQLLSQEEKYDVIFDENEIAYIAMYLASAFETSVKLDRRIRVLVVCSFGTTTSAILDARLRQLLIECEIIGPFSKDEAVEYINKNDVDLIITTHEDSYGKIPCIVVNPLLNQEDTDYIRARIFQISYEKMCLNFMSSYVKQDDNLTKSISIKDIISRDNIQILDNCDSWKQAIEIAAQPLVKSKKIEQRYVIAMIDAVIQLGTYMVLLPETAFVHAGRDSGIYEDCCSLLVLKKPIVFGDVNGKSVRNVIVLGVKNREQLTMLDLVSIFQKDENREILASQNIDIDTILNLHNQKEELVEELVTLDRIGSRKKADNWQEAIMRAGELLLVNKDIEEKYIYNMIDSVNELGPYIVLTKGFALAHSAPCDAVKKTGISLINLEKPVNFGSNNDPVSVVMCLACVDQKSHIDHLKKIAEKLMEDGMIDKLSKCDSDQDLYKTINSKRKEDT